MNVFRFFLLLMILCGFAAGPARAGILELLFPKYKESPLDPSQTLQAPFAVERDEKGMPILPAPADAEQQKKGLPQNAIPLNLPHRNADMVADWLVDAVSESLTFVPGDSAAQEKKMARYFNPSAQPQYQAFLTETKIGAFAQSGRYQIRSFVREKPLLLNQGDVSGVYRWLYEVSVMVTYLPAGKVQYKEIKPINQYYAVTAQVGRSASAGNDDAIWIDSWTGRAQNPPKN